MSIVISDMGVVLSVDGRQPDARYMSPREIEALGAWRRMHPYAYPADPRILWHAAGAGGPGSFRASPMPDHRPRVYLTPPEVSDNPFRRRRGELRLSFTQAAERLGLDIGNLYAWEYKRIAPAPRRIGAIARAYELPVEKAVLMRVELALGRRPSGEPSLDVNAYSLADWARGEPYRALAARCCVHVNTLSRWINGHDMPESRHIPRLAEVLGRSEADVAVACYKAWERAHRHSKGEKTDEQGT